MYLQCTCNAKEPEYAFQNTSNWVFGIATPEEGEDEKGENYLLEIPSARQSIKKDKVQLHM